MKFAVRLIQPLLILAVASAATAASVDYGTISSTVAQVLEQGHYSKRLINADLSREFLSEYLDELDSDHLYFTSKDVEGIINAHGATIGADILAGRLTSAFEIFDLFKTRENARAEKISKLLKTGTFDFKGSNSVEVSRSHSPWPATEVEADQLWHDHIEGELLEAKLDGSSLADSIKTVSNRYNQFHIETQQESKRDGMAVFLNSLATAYDPHSEYLRKQDLEDLDSDMSLSMVGIGVVIEPQGKYVRIVSLLPGSPAAADGRLKVNDRIIGIARDKGNFVDISGMSVDRVLGLIRGRKGTHVRLKVISLRGSERREIDLVSRNIDLVDDEAKADLVERTGAGGEKERLGWIVLPSFYGDPEHPNGRSVSHDVRNLVLRLKRENVSGIVIDLRNNPGGELEEAVEVAGLFLGRVPIVQERDRSGKTYISKPQGKQLYDGPLVVVTDHSTASAAELMASALQDYGRAVIVGGHYPTYGKGSVQTVVELGDVIDGVSKKESAQLGALQLTIAKFYRVNGQSTQLRGLAADIQLPSREDMSDEGESAMKHPLIYDETKPVTMNLKMFDRPLPLAQLKELSAARVATTPEFSYIAEDLERERKKQEANRVSLNEADRRSEMAENTSRDKERDAERKKETAALESVCHITCRDPMPRNFRPVNFEQFKESATTAVVSSTDSSSKQPDAIRAETLNILSDLARLSARKPVQEDRVVENSNSGPAPASTTGGTASAGSATVTGKATATTH